MTALFSDSLLAEEFSDQPVRFLSISDEEESIIEPFLDSQPIAGWVGLDLDRSVFRDYAVMGIPATVLVDKKGVIQAVTQPHHVTKTVLLDLLAGRRPDVPEKSTGTLLAVGDDGPEPVFQVLIRPSTSDRSGMSRSHSEIKIISFLPEHILPVAFNARPGRFLIEAEFPNQKYDVVMNTAGRKDLLESMMQQAVSAALGIEAVWETRMVDAYVLRKSPRRSSSLYRRSRGVTPVRPEENSRPPASRVLRTWSHQGWIGPYSMRQDSMVLIASSYSSILKTILRLLMPSRAPWVWNSSKQDVKFAC